MSQSRGLAAPERTAGALRGEAKAGANKKGYQNPSTINNQNGGVFNLGADGTLLTTTYGSTFNNAAGLKVSTRNIRGQQLRVAGPLLLKLGVVVGVRADASYQSAVVVLSDEEALTIELCGGNIEKKKMFRSQ